MAPMLLDGLYAIHDVPLPAGARRLAYLDLAELAPDEERLVTQLLTATPRERLAAARELTARIRTALGPPNLERY